MPSPDDLVEAMFNPEKEMKGAKSLDKYTDENTSMATYVWLPIRFAECGKPHIEWQNAEKNYS